MVYFSPELVSLTDTTLQTALGTISETGAELLAFAIVEKDGHRALHRFTTESPRDSAGVARDFAASQDDADRIAVASVDLVDVGGERFDAVVVEAWDLIHKQVQVVGQRYDTAGAAGAPILLDHSGAEGT
ncbi:MULTISPECIES: hypothetical protein [unclassified Cryobacterium]|uniref:hypothetical protein n=1 Tax=unclassified Cryobacterium TaxID=2649013 RepID=UPI0014483EFD|nr:MULTISPECIES: hypothetical protein [unclassified Cryobacterium]